MNCGIYEAKKKRDTHRELAQSGFFRFEVFLGGSVQDVMGGVERKEGGASCPALHGYFYDSPMKCALTWKREKMQAFVGRF